MNKRIKKICITGLLALAFAAGCLIGRSAGYSAGKAQAEVVEKEVIKEVVKEVPVIKYVEIIKERDEQEDNSISEAAAEQENTEPKSLGIFTATAYCPCIACSEEWGNNTATGAVATEGKTIAVDPKVIPYGTRVIINGHTYIAEDCGGAIKGNMVDIYFDTHAETVKFGRQQVEVFVKE